MQLTIPVPTVDPGPDWANNLNASLTIIDSHTHATGSGLAITPAAININTALTYNGNFATNVGGVSMTAQTTTPAVGTMYMIGTNLYWIGSGTPVQITNGSSLAGAAGTITGLPSGTASASFQSVSGTFQWLQATSTAANLDAGTLIVRYPGSYPTPSGNYIAIEAPSTLSSGFALTLPFLPAQTNVMTLSSAGVMSSITYDALGQGMTSVGATAIAGNISAGTLTGGQLANNTITGTQITTALNLTGNLTVDGQAPMYSSSGGGYLWTIAHGQVEASGSLYTGQGIASTSVGFDVYGAYYTINLSAVAVGPPTILLTPTYSGVFYQVESIVDHIISNNSFVVRFIQTSGGGAVPLQTAFNVMAIVPVIS